MRRLHALTLLLAAAVSGAACRGRADGPRRIAVADVSGPALGLVFIAEEKGYFRDERLAIDYQHFDLGRDALAALLHGKADVAMAYLTPVARRALDDRRLRILTTLHHSHENTAVVARSDRGIRSVADLRGKRVGRPANTNAVLFLETLLTMSGVPSSAVEFVDVEPEALGDALAAGRVDAVAMTSPYWERARRRLGGGAVELTSKVYTEMTVLLTRDDVLRARRDELVKVLRALARAERFAQQDHDGAIDVLRKRFPEEERSDLEEQWRHIVPHLGLHNFLLTALEREAAFLSAPSDPARPLPDLRFLLASEPLREVAPDAVTVGPRPTEAR